SPCCVRLVSARRGRARSQRWSGRTTSTRQVPPHTRFPGSFSLLPRAACFAVSQTRLLACGRGDQGRVDHRRWHASFCWLKAFADCCCSSSLLHACCCFFSSSCALSAACLLLLELHFWASIDKFFWWANAMQPVVPELV